MKKLTYYFPILLIGLILFGCEKPAPTELAPDNSSATDQVQIEVITKDTADSSYSNGFDTTGVVSNPTNYTNLIVVSGIKLTKNMITIKRSLAQCVFFDRNRPIYGQNGKLMGFRTRTLGEVSFDGITAFIVPYRLKFMYLGREIDTLLGSKYELVGINPFNPNQFNFRYNSTVNFNFVPKMGQQTNFDIPTPPQINGNVSIAGHKANKTLRALLDWNKANDKNIEIIIGVVTKDRKNVFPLFKLTTSDDGQLIVPPKLLNGIPFDKFDEFVFTFIRKYKSNHTYGGNNLDILSQSIHSIFIDIP